MEIDIDLNKRIEWIKSRVDLDELTEQYVRLQMQEVVIETVGKVKNLTIPVVTNRFTEKQMDDAYDKGYNDGHATGSTPM